MTYSYAKCFLPLIIFMDFSIVVFAKGKVEFQEWGKVSLEELKMTECSFEKEAEALFLLDMSHISFSERNRSFSYGGDFFIKERIFQRIKIFNKKGLERADFRLTYNAKASDDILDIQAVSYNLENGEIKKTELQEKDIRIAKLNAYENEVTFAVPNVTADTVFEISYVKSTTVSYSLTKWNFNGPIPSVKSQLKIDFLDAIMYYVDIHILEGSLEQTKVRNESMLNYQSRASNFTSLPGTEISYTTHNLHSVKVEPFMKSINNYLSWISFELKGFGPPLNTFADITNDFSKFSSKITENNYVTEALNGNGINEKVWHSLLEGVNSERERAKILYELVRDNVITKGNAGYMPMKSVGDVWKDKTGYVTDINLVLLSILTKAGIKASPILVSNRQHGAVNQGHPVFNDYVALNVLVTFIDGSEVVVDASHRYLPFGIPPFSTLNTLGLALDGKDRHHWKVIADIDGNKQLVSITGEINEDGMLTGEAKIVSTNYGAEVLIGAKKNGEQYLSALVKKLLPNANIIAAHDSEDLASMRHYIFVRFTHQMMTDNEGNIYVNLSSVYNANKEPFNNVERLSDVDFGFKDKEVLILFVKAPSNYTIDSLIPSFKLMTADTCMNFNSSADFYQSTLSLTQRIEYQCAFVPVDRYPALFEFFQKYYNYKQQPVVLKRKS